MFEFYMACLMAHALGDFAFQSTFIAQAKNRHNAVKVAEIQNKEPDRKLWIYVMAMHSLINGAMFYLLTGNIVIGTLESIFHFVIDTVKCEGKTNIHVDQFIHFCCIIFYTMVI